MASGWKLLVSLKPMDNSAPRAVRRRTGGEIVQDVSLNLALRMLSLRQVFRIRGQSVDVRRHNGEQVQICGSIHTGVNRKELRIFPRQSYDPPSVMRSSNDFLWESSKLDVGKTVGARGF